MKLAQTRKEAFKEMCEQFSQALSNNGCNDYQVANTPEMFLALEEAGAMNLNMTLEAFRASAEYEDYKPNVSPDKRKIYCQDYSILALMEKELGLR